MEAAASLRLASPCLLGPLRSNGEPLVTRSFSGFPQLPVAIRSSAGDRDFFLAALAQLAKDLGRQQFGSLGLRFLRGTIERLDFLLLQPSPVVQKEGIQGTGCLVQR